MKFRGFGGKLEISNRCGNPPTTFLRNDQLCFGVTQTDTIFANAQNYSYKPHRLEISGRMNLQGDCNKPYSKDPYSNNEDSTESIFRGFFARGSFGPNPLAGHRKSTTYRQVGEDEAILTSIPMGSMGLVYLLSFTINLSQM